MSTYSNSGIELIGTGEQSGTWGTTTNTNLQIIDRLTNGVGAISLSGTTHTLTTSDGSLSDGQYAVLVFGGSPSGTNTVTISPNDATHFYVVKNSSGQSVVLTQGSGGNVTVANGDTKLVYADGAGAGAAVVDITNDLAMGSVNITGGSITGITDLAVADGGTGVSTTPSNGQLLIGNGSGYTVSTLTAGSGVSITNGSGSVTINATGSGGTVTSVGITAGALIDVTGSPITTSGNITVNVDLSELTDMTATMVGTDEFVVLDSGAQRRKAANEIGLSIFNNDSGFLTTINNSNWSGTDLSVANGGTGASSFTANNVLLGNGTSSFQTVAPGTSGNVLTSNGTTWESTAPAGGGAWEYVSTGTASNSASINFTLPAAGYAGIAFVIDSLYGAIDGIDFYCIINSRAADWCVVTQTTGTTGTSDATGIKLSDEVDSNGAVFGGLNMVVYVGGNYASSTYTQVWGNGVNLTQNSAAAKTLLAAGRFTTAEDNSGDTISFKMQASTITSGTIHMYYIKES